MIDFIITVYETNKTKIWIKVLVAKLGSIQIKKHWRSHYIGFYVSWTKLMILHCTSLRNYWESGILVYVTKRDSNTPGFAMNQTGFLVQVER